MGEPGEMDDNNTGPGPQPSRLKCSAPAADAPRGPGGRREADIPAQHAQASEEARLPLADAHQGRPSGAQEPAGQRPPTDLGVTGRIRRGAQFRAFAAGTRCRRGPLAITVAPSLQPGIPRIGYTISRAVGPAVVRNRLRRQLRHAFASVAPRLDDQSAYLVSATRGATTLTYGELERLVGALAHEVHPS